MLLRSLLLAVLLGIAAPTPAQVTEPTPRGELTIPDAARPGRGFDIERATRAYLDTLAAPERRKSDAYFEGGYWLLLWNFLYGLGVAALLLFGWLSAGLRNRAERVTRRPWLQAPIYAAGIIVLNALLVLPFDLYAQWLRERQYDLSNLALGQWFAEAGKGLAIQVVLGTILLPVIFAVVRRRGGNWWVPASVVSIVFLFFVVLIEPVFVAPVFNDYHALGPGPVRDAVLSLARANGVQADEVYWFDASKQTTRISANVSGLGSTTRIALNDNLLGKTSVPEINAVMAHELGHYVLDHVTKLVVELGVVVVIGFAFTQWAQHRLLARYGARWGIRGPGDMAGLPLVIAVLSVWLFVTTPVRNTIVRANEIEADLFGLNAAREPHGFASVAMRLATYRKLDPARLEELIFFDHPSGRARVHMAMTWFAEHQDAGAGGKPRSP